MKLDSLDSLRLGRGLGYEMPETRFIRAALRPGDVFVDVGAHIGYHSINAAEVVGSTGAVYAFEPEEENFEALLENVAGFPQAVAFRTAISNYSGDLMLYPSRKNTGDHRIYPQKGRTPQGPVVVRTLDEALRAYRPPNFIKIDVQGSEAAVLEGAKETLENGAEITLLIEFFPAGLEAEGSGVRKFFDLLRPFRLFLLTRPGILFEVDERGVVASASVNGRDHVNIVARRRS